MNTHPNAVVTGTTTSAGILLVWLLGHFGISLSTELGAVIAGGTATLFLFIGRKGIRGLFEMIWRGSEEKA